MGDGIKGGNSLSRQWRRWLAGGDGVKDGGSGRRDERRKFADEAVAVAVGRCEGGCNSACLMRRRRWLGTWEKAAAACDRCTSLGDQGKFRSLLARLWRRLWVTGVKEAATGDRVKGGKSHGRSWRRWVSGAMVAASADIWCEGGSGGPPG